MKDCFWLWMTFRQRVWKCRRRLDRTCCRSVSHNFNATLTVLLRTTPTRTINQLQILTLKTNSRNLQQSFSGQYQLGWSLNWPTISTNSPGSKSSLSYLSKPVNTVKKSRTNDPFIGLGHCAELLWYIWLETHQRTTWYYNKVYLITASQIDN